MLMAYQIKFFASTMDRDAVEEVRNGARATQRKRMQGNGAWFHCPD